GIVETANARFRAQIYLPYYDETWKPGDKLSGEGWLKRADGDAEEGNSYYRSIGVWMRGGLDDSLTVDAAKALAVRYWPAYLAQKLRVAAQSLFPEDVRGYMLALLTGDKSGLSYQQKSDLKISGIYHALAVSGMHVAILMSVLSVASGRSRVLYSLLGLPVLIFYCVMVGGMASVVRAAVMQIFLMLGPLLRREPDAPTSLAAALLLLSVQNPWSLLNVGLQLSFLATVGILLFHSRIYAALMKKPPMRLRRIRILCANTVAATLSATVLTLPVMAHCFGMVSLLSVLTNLLALQAITLSFHLGFLAAILFAVWTPAAAIPAWICTWLLRYTAWITALIARIPFAAVYLQKPYLVCWLLFCYLILIILCTCRVKATRAIVCSAAGCGIITLCAALMLTWLDHSGNAFVFSALDVGQGQSLLYQSRGSAMVVDCGGSYGDQAGDLLAETLLDSGENRLDYLVLTHYDEDHTGGIEQLLHRMMVGTILMPDTADDDGNRATIEALADASGTDIVYVTHDLQFSLGTGTVTVFAPQRGEEGNAASLAVLAQFADYDILATGDMPISQEEWLLASHTLPDLELLIAGHHGSSSSTGALLLRQTTPETVVISVGKNSYGHPTAEVLERILNAGAQVFRTDLHGTVTVRR
ncbi:MAG: DNA internalization-related competence protein ComEC/Rec2, partial [Oscillospiraceae bacterium]|nr:DNA internalization-related competence protein ComEC/Rec2 [Oscillospiraceae bacterium]